MNEAEDDPRNITESPNESAFQMEVVADVYQHQQQTRQQSQRNIQSTQTRPYSNAERQRRYREKRKADKMNACITFSQSSDVQPQQEQPQHDVQINKRQPQSNAERQRKYRKSLREQQQRQQQMEDINAITVLSTPHTSSIDQLQNVDQAEHARKRHLNKLRQSRFRARQRFESPSTSSHQAQAERLQEPQSTEGPQTLAMPEAIEKPFTAEVPQPTEVLQAAEVPQAVKVDVPLTTEAPTEVENSTPNSLLIEIQPIQPSEIRIKDLRTQLKFCVVPTCLKNQITNPELTFFSLPNDTSFRKYWCKRIDREDLWLLPLTQVSKYHVCNIHFEDKYMFHFGSKTSNTSKLVLLSKAIPTLELPLKRRERKKPKKKEGVQCSVTTCHNNTKINSELKFFFAPQKKDLAVMWMHNMGLKYFRKSPRHIICEKHFEKRCIKINRQGNHILLANAVPTLNLPISDEEIKHFQPKVKSQKLKPKNERTRKTVSTQTTSFNTVEFVDLNKEHHNEDEPHVKIMKGMSSKEPHREENVKVKVEENDNDFTVVISTNPLDPDIADAIHDSLAEACIKTEPVELQNRADNLYENTIATTKYNIKELYENGTEEMRLLLYHCDRYCSERTNGTLQLQKEILS